MDVIDLCSSCSDDDDNSSNDKNVDSDALPQSRLPLTQQRLTASNKPYHDIIDIEEEDDDDNSNSTTGCTNTAGNANSTTGSSDAPLPTSTLVVNPYNRRPRAKRKWNSSQSHIEDSGSDASTKNQTNHCNNTRAAFLTGNSNSNSSSNSRSTSIQPSCTTRITGSTTTTTSNRDTTACRNLPYDVVVFPHNNDTAIATSGILPVFLSKFGSNKNVHSHTSTHTTSSGSCYNTQRPTPTPPTAVTVSPPTSKSSTGVYGMLHIQQNDKWSCGYRNLQMLLSAILPDLSQRQPQPQRHSLPSLDEIQASLDELWSKGYDRIGAEHYHYRIRQQSQWIGAVEVANYLSYQYRIDATVVEFILCHKSRSLLSSFCKSYFAKQSPTQHISSCPYSCHYNDTDVAANTTSEITRDILQSIERGTPSWCNGTDENLVIPTCNCPTVPLYLQWNGHSVTIIGIELHTNHLIILDPKCNGSNIKKALLQPRSPLPSVMRLSMSKLIHRDCQIILTSTNSTLSQYQLDQIRRNNVPSMTAANDVVTKIRSEQQLLLQHPYH